MLERSAPSRAAPGGGSPGGQPHVADLLHEQPQELLHVGVLVGVASQQVAELAGNTNRLVTEQGQPAVENLNKAISSVQRAADNLDGMIGDARPGVQNFSKSTLPELNQTVRQMRQLTQSLQDVADRVNQEGIGGTLGPEKLPDYKPRKNK